MDEDIQYALQAVRTEQEVKRTQGTRKKQAQKQNQLALDRLETMVELLADEVEQYIPRTNPRFLAVLSLVVLRKMQRQVSQEPEEKSPLEMWPEGY